MKLSQGHIACSHVPEYIDLGLPFSGLAKSVLFPLLRCVKEYFQLGGKGNLLFNSRTGGIRIITDEPGADEPYINVFQVCDLL